MSALSDLLVSANSGGMSARSIARAARAQGFTLNHDTAARYLRGDHGRPDEPTLVALSTVLDVPLADLRRAASLPSDLTEPYVPPSESSRLTRRQRRAVDEIIRAMLEPISEAAVDSPQPDRSGTGSAADTDEKLAEAARRGDPESSHIGHQPDH